MFIFGARADAVPRLRKERPQFRVRASLEHVACEREAVWCAGGSLWLALFAGGRRRHNCFGADACSRHASSPATPSGPLLPPLSAFYP